MSIEFTLINLKLIIFIGHIINITENHINFR